MDLTYIIKKPLLTEKSAASNETGRYAFEVDMRASKVDIKKAVETLFKVKVEKVNTMITPDKDRRKVYGVVKGKETKKAVVRLQEGQTIQLF